MWCSVCGSAAISERPERTTQGYRRYRSGTCGKQFNERSIGVLNRAQYPSVGLQRVCRRINVEIVKRSDLGKFVVLPRRWVVERSIAWLNRCRRLAKDWECLNRNALAFLRWASVRLMVRKLCQETK